MNVFQYALIAAGLAVFMLSMAFKKSSEEVAPQEISVLTEFTVMPNDEQDIQIMVYSDSTIEVHDIWCNETLYLGTDTNLAIYSVLTKADNEVGIVFNDCSDTGLTPQQAYAAIYQCIEIGNDLCDYYDGKYIMGYY